MVQILNGETALFKILLFTSIFVSAQAISQENLEAEGKTPFQYTQAVQDKIKKLKTIEPSEYEKQSLSIRNDVDKFIELKKRVCNGEFSTLILEKKNITDLKLEEKAAPKKKLNREERKLCLSELRAIQESYINNLFVARKNYLEHIHAKQLNDLQKVKEMSIKKLR